MAQKVGQLFEKHVIKSVQQIQNIPTGCIPIGLEDTFPCPKCLTELNIVGRGVNAAMYFTCPTEGCNAQMVKWQKDEEVEECPGCDVTFFTFRSWNDYVRKSHCRKCGHVYCAACLEEVVIPGYGKKIMDKYYMKQKACQKCRDEVATMPPPPPPPPPGSAEEEELGRQQDELDTAIDEAVDAPCQFNATDTSGDEPPPPPPPPPPVFEEPVEPPPAKADPYRAKPTKGLFDDDDGDIFADKPKEKKALGMFDDDDDGGLFAQASPDSKPQAGGLFD